VKGLFVLTRMTPPLSFFGLSDIHIARSNVLVEAARPQTAPFFQIKWIGAKTDGRRLILEAIGEIYISTTRRVAGNPWRKKIMKSTKLTSLKAHAQQGFTLIELVMVIVVIGILAAVAMPRYVDLSGAASSAAAKAGYQNVQTSLAAAMAVQANTTPSDPRPLMSTVIAGINGGRANTAVTGLCAGSGYSVLTFTDIAGTTATTATTSKVGSLAAAAAVDSTCP
jgi:prepilin-type N-terminal cleavage/methylation domain-containing protein